MIKTIACGKNVTICYAYLFYYVSVLIVTVTGAAITIYHLTQAAYSGTALIIIVGHVS